MANTRKPANRKTKPAVKRPPVEGIRALAPDLLPFGDLMAIQHETGIDPLDPPSRAAAIAAVAWFCNRDRLTWAEARKLNLDSVDLVVDLDQWLADGDEGDDPDGGSPTGGSGTRESA